MLSKNRWLFETYLGIFLIFALLKVQRLFDAGSPEYLFYFLLRSFDAKFYFNYIAHILHVALYLIHCIPLFCAIYGIRFLHPHFWKILLALRCLFVVTGQTYQAKTLNALYLANDNFLYLIFAVMVVPQIPSYVICYFYAFRQEKLMKS